MSSELETGDQFLI